MNNVPDMLNRRRYAAFLTVRQVYALVWSMPLHRLAPLLGLTDNGVKKKCLALEIPLPIHGYWHKLHAGKPTPPRPDLNVTDSIDKPVFGIYLPINLRSFANNPVFHDLIAQRTTLVLAPRTGVIKTEPRSSERQNKTAKQPRWFTKKIKQRPPSPRSSEPLPLASHIERWEGACSETMSAATLEQYRPAVRRLCKYIVADQTALIIAQDLAAKLSDRNVVRALLTEAGVASSSLPRSMSAIQTFIAYLVSVSDDPLELPGPPSPNITEPQGSLCTAVPDRESGFPMETSYPNSEQMTDTLDAVDVFIARVHAVASVDNSADNRERWTILRDRALYVLMREQGLTLLEALRLREETFSDLLAKSETDLSVSASNADKRKAIDVCGKGERAREVILKASVTAAVVSYLQSLPSDLRRYGALFISTRGTALQREVASRDFKARLKDFGISADLTIRMLRDGFLREQLRQGLPLEKVAREVNFARRAAARRWLREAA